MARHRRLKGLFYVNLAIIILLIGYKAYLNVVETDFQAVHTRQIARIQTALEGREHFRFAVVGNINNSVGVFERKIVPRLNAADIDFVVSAGNAVSGGGEDKYRAVYRTLGHLQVPYVLTFGEQERSRLGSFRFYEHFGPYFYAFSAGGARLIFLDTTGKTPYQWQLRWLEDELAAGHGEQTFLFMAHPIHRSGSDTLLDEPDDYLRSPALRDRLIELIDRHQVTAVFAGNPPFYSRHRRGGTAYITTGGAGGLVLNNDRSFYHYVTVEVSPSGTEISLQRLDVGQHRIFKILESLWFSIHSLFYVGYLNFLLLISILGLVAYKLYALIFAGRDYYRRYDLDPTPYLERPLRVAMFTNNYLPFIGGVPLSIERLCRGLRGLGHQVLVVAPRYGRGRSEAGVVRVPSLLTLGSQREFRLANLFLPGIGRRVRGFAPELIHLHHPFWLGSLGLWLARRRRVPAVYTYHTRLEHYAHFVPLPGLLFRNLVSHYLIKRFANKCDGVIVPTYSAEEYLRLLGVQTPIFVQPTGIDYRRFRDVPAEAVAALRDKLGLGEERVLISVSRLSKEKNIDFLIDAVADLERSADQPFTFLMIGDGADRERIRERVESLGLTDTFRLLRAVPPEEIPLYYRLGDAFLFASKSETQGMVILEAMAAGLPVVAVRSSGIDDAVHDGVNGYKTPERLDHWCARVRELLADEPLRRRLGTAARRYARGFDVGRVAEETTRIYAEVLAAQDQRRPIRNSGAEPSAQDSARPHPRKRP